LTRYPDGVYLAFNGGWLWAKARPSPEPDIAHVYAAPTIAGPEVIAALQAGATVTLVPGAMTGSP